MKTTDMLGRIIGILYALICGGYLCVGIGFWRLGEVDAYRASLIEQIHHCAHAEEKAGLPWRWRYEVYEAVSFDDMMKQFWRPLASFYADSSFRNCPASEDR